MGGDAVRRILAIAVKDIRIEFSERMTWVVFFVLPLLFTAVLGVSMGSAFSTGETRIPVRVVDEDGSRLSRHIVDALASSSSLAVQSAAGEAKVPLEVVIPRGTEARVLQGDEAVVHVRRLEKSVNAVSAAASVRAALTPVVRAASVARLVLQTAERLRPFASPTERKAFFYAAFEAAYRALEHVPVRVEVKSVGRGPQAAGLSGFEQASAGQLVTWTLITLLGAAEALVSERVRGTLRRLLVMPVSKTVILTGKMVGRLSLGVMQMVILILAGQWFFHVNWGRSPLALTVVALTFALSVVALGIALSTLVRDPRQANGVIVLSSLTLAALGGAWWPLEITPPLYQKVAHLLPSTWAMQAFTVIIARGGGVSDVLPEIGVLLAFTALFLALGVWRLRWE